MEERYALELIEKGKRIDGRKFEDYREIGIERGAAKNAEGSARVRFGETQVMVGVKIGVGEPFPDTPKEGILVVNSEFTPLASPEFESGPPGEDAIELARIIDRGIRESKAIDMEKLMITEGEKVYSVFIDVHILNHAGNLVDAAALAAVSALNQTKIPKLEDDKLVRDEFAMDLPLQFSPVTVTVCKIGDNFIVDPTAEEESVVDSKVTVAFRDDGNICAMQKQGPKELDFDDVKKMVDIAFMKSKELRKLLE